MINPKNWWRNNSETWLKKMAYWEQQSKGNSKHFIEERNFIISEIEYHYVNNPDVTVLEVGAGNGRIIGGLSEMGIDGFEYYNCSSIDINSKLSEYVAKEYPRVETFVGEIIDLPFKDNEFDLVYTHEVLQHIEPSEIEKACSELKRVGKEVWTLENWRDKDPDIKVSDSHGGRWNWDLKKYFNVYYEFYTDWGQMFLKSKE